MKSPQISKDKKELALSLPVVSLLALRNSKGSNQSKGLALRKRSESKGFTRLVDFGDVLPRVKRIYTSPKFTTGFTLMEIIVVMSIVAILGGLGLYYGLDNLWRQSFHSNRDSLISALERARSESISNICLGTSCTDGKTHGVYIDQANKKYIIFQGDSYNSRDTEQDAEIKADYDIDYTGIKEVVFQKLSGDIIKIDNTIVDFNSSIKNWEINLKDNVTSKTSVIELNIEGQISWKN